MKMPEIEISVGHLTKNYHFRTVFEEISEVFESPKSVAVLGENGSGKSTFLKILSGMAGPTSGKVRWSGNGKEIPSHRWYEKLTFCSPKLEFDSRFTVWETVDMFIQNKPFPHGLQTDDLIDLMTFQSHAQKAMNELSSGMYQRVRLVLTVCAAVPVLFLDEPCSNLDAKGVTWYNDLIEKYSRGKLVFVASNDPREYQFCTSEINIMDFK